MTRFTIAKNIFSHTCYVTKSIMAIRGNVSLKISILSNICFFVQSNIC
jgi:hypothetical protein